jgi:hypothetical protein
MFTDYLVAYKYKLWEISNGLKGILSTKIVICSCPKLLSFSVLTFIKWRLTASYAAKDTIFGRYFTSIHLSPWIRQSPLYSTSWHFLFCPRTTCCLLFLNSAHCTWLVFRRLCHPEKKDTLINVKWNIKGILSTKIVIFSYPKLYSSVRADDLERDIHRRYTILEKKIQSTLYQYMEGEVITIH